MIMDGVGLSGGMEIPESAYQELESAVEKEFVSREPAVLDGYAWQPMGNEDPAKRVKRPVAVVLPSSAEEVQEVVRVCNRHGLRFKAFATGWGIFSAVTYDNVVHIDLRRMDRILDLDERNMYAVVEPCVCGAQLQAEAMKVGLIIHIIGAGPVCSPLASATSGWGVGWDSVYMSYSARNVLGVEWVLPEGEIIRLGSLGSGTGWFSGDGPGPSLRGLMSGSTGALGGLGVFTKGAIKLYGWPGPPRVETEGMLLDARSEVPENIRFHLCVFPDRKRLADVVYRIGESEIGYLATKTSIAAFEKRMEPLSSCDARLRKTISPMMGHYNEWQKRLSRAVDPKRAADTGEYCDEGEFDFSKIEPELKARLDRRIAERSWTESGPTA